MWSVHAINFKAKLVFEDIRRVAASRASLACWVSTLAIGQFRNSSNPSQPRGFPSALVRPRSEFEAAMCSHSSYSMPFKIFRFCDLDRSRFYRARRVAILRINKAT
jgi:hypothetical protein